MASVLQKCSVLCRSLPASAAVKAFSRSTAPCASSLQTKDFHSGAAVYSQQLATVGASSKYGGRYTVTMIPGDGIGPELMAHVKDVFRYAGVPVDFEEVQITSQEGDDVAIENAITAIKRNGVALKGGLKTLHLDPSFGVSRNVAVRVRLDLFANVLRCKTFPGLPSRHGDIDIVIIRENTEGEYTSLEHENVPGVVESYKIITAKNSERIARYAFEYAQRHGRKKVTAVHKANIMKMGDGLFLECCKKMSEEFPNIEYESMIIDNCSMQMVSRPQQFDVMVMPNLYGNIISNIGAGLVGGPGLVPGENIGQEYAVFETATRNTGKSIAGQNVANPTAMLLASALMLEHLGLDKYASLIENAVYKALADDKIRTPDLGGQHSTVDMVQTVVKEVEAQAAKL
ncbi:isocitrate dehydrogenase [NAD] subunit gamma, mitochondrial-like isoform X2 [Branchiostoma floridae]|uniref:Isocitrate dehydrogenase [NAD] subunit, mitochondrial n=2 Tax=Branchiostoma floridae TaxID=7739 RepID=A0A9J7L6F1_BRAFL|nr:isocitrate dehydrogenase [NAD] subunit gamma, mitochondrial-like isoform X2 [Branchiostoma floridae]